MSAEKGRPAANKTADVNGVTDKVSLPRRTDTSHRSEALALASAGWEVLPLSGKVPLTRHGVLDASSNLAVVARWWTSWPSANIGARVPGGLIMFEVDPRKDGSTAALAAYWDRHGPFPLTLSVLTGRGDGGRHWYFQKPTFGVTQKRLPEGLEIKTHSGYVVLPPSVHPDTGGRYTWANTTPPAMLPHWLGDLLRKPVPAWRSRSVRARLGSVRSTRMRAENLQWRDVLEPYGWVCVDVDGDADGARWRHPTATSTYSATVRHACLFVYSPNTPFDVTEPGTPRGYTKQKATKILAAANGLRSST